MTNQNQSKRIFITYLNDYIATHTQKNNTINDNYDMNSLLEEIMYYGTYNLVIDDELSFEGNDDDYVKWHSLNNYCDIDLDRTAIDGNIYCCCCDSIIHYFTSHKEYLIYIHSYIKDQVASLMVLINNSQ